MEDYERMMSGGGNRVRAPKSPTGVYSPEQIIRYLKRTDQAGDGWVGELAQGIKKHPRWVLTKINPRDTKWNFNLYEQGDVQDYSGSGHLPVVAFDGDIMDGSHRASLAYWEGAEVEAFVPEDQA